MNETKVRALTTFNECNTRLGSFVLIYVMLLKQFFQQEKNPPTSIVVWISMENLAMLSDTEFEKKVGKKK